MRDIFSVFTERKIQEAIARGDFNNLHIFLMETLLFPRRKFLKRSIIITS